MLVSHPDRCAHWAQTLAQVPVPVLRETRDALARWEQMADRADANSLADTVLRDPLMTLRVFACVSQRFGERLSTPVETVTGAIVLLGIEPFFALMADLPVLEDRLAGNPPALAGGDDIPLPDRVVHLQATDLAVRAAGKHFALNGGNTGNNESFGHDGYSGGYSE